MSNFQFPIKSTNSLISKFRNYIGNWKLETGDSHARHEHGFSLFEILVVMAIFVLLVLVANQAFFAAFRGQNKSEVTTTVKQNANFVVSTMERAFHSAQSVSSCTATKITFFDSAGREEWYSCDAGAVKLKSGSLISTNEVVVSGCNFSCVQEGGKKTVILNMTFDQAGTTGLRVEEKSTYQIQTQIRLRN